MGEGCTPLLTVDLNEGPLYLKYEGQNPTGSHKDRMSALIVTRAIEKGYRGVAVASSGNAGLSFAAYCAYSGLDCIVISTRELNKNIQSYIKYYGARLILTETAMQRWEQLKQLTKEGFYPGSNYANPPIGTVHFGVQGYKCIAYEIVSQLQGSIPTKIIVPTSRGDLLAGIWQGFKEMEMNSLPKMIAVEPFARITAVLKGEAYTNSFAGKTVLKSIAGSTVTYQAVSAVRQSRGEAIVVSGEEALEAQRQLMKKGIFLEVSSASVVSAYQKLRRRRAIDKDDLVVAIGTSSGFIEI
nr:pyridoxal-phosphate dependent enzyme [Anoxybacillus tepidamans]